MKMADHVQFGFLDIFFSNFQYLPVYQWIQRIGRGAL